MGQVWGYELGLNDDMDQVWGYRDYELWMIRIIIVMVYYSYIRGYECYMLQCQWLAVIMLNTYMNYMIRSNKVCSFLRVIHYNCYQNYKLFRLILMFLWFIGNKCYMLRVRGVIRVKNEGVIIFKYYRGYTIYELQVLGIKDCRIYGLEIITTRAYELSVIMVDV